VGSPLEDYLCRVIVEVYLGTVREAVVVCEGYEDP
jgi:hypothetical protein